MAAGASLLWRDELRCGRHNEQPGDVRLLTKLRVSGAEIYRHDLTVGPDAPIWSGPTVLAGTRSIGTLLIVDDAWQESGPPPTLVLGPTAAAMPLNGPAMLVTALARDSAEVRRHLDAAGEQLGH